MSLIIKPKFSQRDLKWKNDRHGTSNSTIGKTGCTISCAAMLLNYFGTSITPKELDDKLTANRGYAQGNLLIWSAITRLFPKVKHVGRYAKYDNRVVKGLVNDGVPVMVEVKADVIGSPLGRHWVLFIGSQKCIDPWTSLIESTAKYTPTGYSVYVKN